MRVATGRKFWFVAFLVGLKGAVGIWEARDAVLGGLEIDGADGVEWDIDFAEGRVGEVEGFGVGDFGLAGDLGLVGEG